MPETIRIGNRSTVGRYWELPVVIWDDPSVALLFAPTDNLVPTLWGDDRKRMASSAILFLLQRLEIKNEQLSWMQMRH